MQTKPAFSLERKGLSNQTDTTQTINRGINSCPPRLPSLSYAPEGLSNATSEHVLAYLADAESREANVWLKDDLRIAWLTVLNCAEGKADPWRYAFWMYLGRTPERLIPEFVARAERHRLMEVPDYDPTVKLPPSAALPPKKEIA